MLKNLVNGKAEIKIDYPDTNYTLGIDMGVASIGTALIDEDSQKIIHLGVRSFRSPSSDSDNNSKTRRLARLQRRQTARRNMRQHKLFTYLQEISLLPELSNEHKDFLNAPISEEFKTFASKRRENVRRCSIIRNQILTQLDSNLLKIWTEFLEHRPHYAKDYLNKLPYILPYFIRTIALDEKLDRYSLGRIIYHFSQRRGFLSNRKNIAVDQDDEKKSKISSSIESIENAMNANKYRTLGEYFARHVNINEGEIRKKYTSRKMFTKEFNLIINSQSELINEINSIFIDKNIVKYIYKILFFQRPLKSCKNKIGGCELEDGINGKRNIKRAKKCLLSSQNFRVWQSINNLKIISITDNSVERPLTERERNLVYSECTKHSDVSLVKLPNILNLSNEKFKNDMYVMKEKKKDSFTFKNLDRKIPGNRTLVNISKHFKDFYNLEISEQEKIVNAIISFDDTDALIKHFIDKRGIPKEIATKLANIQLEDGYLSYSTKAVNKLLPYLQAGKKLTEAINLAGYSNNKNNSKFDFLPPYLTINKYLNNKSVLRSLSQLRLVINSIIKKFGKPKVIRVELARELKLSQKDKVRLIKQNLINENEKKSIKNKLIENGINSPNFSDIEKYKLWKECNFECPYTGKSISFYDLFGENPKFDVEHIIPLSRSCNDSFSNKTLCLSYVNREEKKNLTPFEAFANRSPDKYEQMLKRVENFKSVLKFKKLSLFKAKNVDSEFNSRMLNDTRYASKLTTQYLSLLYGGLVDSNGKLRIRVSSGQVTSLLRKHWKLNTLLSYDNTKTREDYRHHAIDALVIALTNEKSIQIINRASASGNFVFNKRFSKLEFIWDDLLEKTREHLDKMMISFFVSTKENNLFHKETFLGKNNNKFYHRKSIDLLDVKKDLRENDININLKNAIQSKLEENIKNNKVFDKSDLNTLPYFTVKNKNKKSPYSKEVNQKIYIKSFKKYIPNKENSILEIGTDIQKKFVAKNTNHHISVFSHTIDKKICFITSSFLEINKRKILGEKLVLKDHPNSSEFKFLFYLKKYDTFEIEKEGKKQYRVVKSITSEGVIYHTGIFDARMSKEQRKSSDFNNNKIDKLIDMKFRKLKISPIGDILD